MSNATKQKDPVNYLMTNIPDFDLIVPAFRYLHKRNPSKSELEEIQQTWNKDKEKAAASSKEVKSLDTVLLP